MLNLQPAHSGLNGFFVVLLLVFSNELLFLYPESVIGFEASKEQGPRKWNGYLSGTLSSSQLMLVLLW